MNTFKQLLAETRKLRLEQERNHNKPKPFYIMVNVTPLEDKMLVAEFEVCLN